MLLLSVDTSGKSGGISLAQGDENDFRILASAPIVGGTFSAQLIPTLASLLRERGLAAHDLQGFVAVSGPGSFTGLRVGLSAIKGLAEALHQPLATVSLLEALAISAGREGKVGAALDAGREEVYLGIYNVNSGRGSCMVEQLLSYPEFEDAIRGFPLVVTCDPTILPLAVAAGIVGEKMERPGSDEAARIGLRKLLAGETVSVEELDANYIRRSDAEIFSRPNL
jgi:tRNA threonylcarbamoyladenosine biosynthesis protein TsaB